MKIAIVGSRNYPRPNDIRECVEKLRRELVGSDTAWPWTIISGGAKGVDTFAVEAAKDNGFDWKVYHADWDKHGKSAGYIRNKEMVAAADKVIAFWDGTSKGTRHSIDLALAMKKNLEVHFP